MVKNLPAMQGAWVRSLFQEDPLEEGRATHSGTLAWGIPWTEEPGGPGGPQSMGSHRVGHDCCDSAAAAYTFLSDPVVLGYYFLTYLDSFFPLCVCAPKLGSANVFFILTDFFFSSALSKTIC